MSTFKFWALIGAATMVAACDSGPSTDSKDTDADTDSGADTDDSSMMDDTDPVDVTPMWDVADWTDAITVDCGANSFTLEMRTMNWGYNASFYMGETRFTKDYDEEHTFVDDENGPDETTYTVFNRTLTTDAAFGSATPDVNTVFNCADGDIDPASTTDFQVTFAAVVYEADGTTLADCVVFGHDPDALLGTVPAALAPPAWVTAANCRDINP
jgi:hypothetical protein